MATLFLLLHFAALVSFFVFFVKSIRLKKSGQNNSKEKKLMLCSVIVWFVAFILVGITVPKTENSEKVAEATTEDSVEASLEATVEKHEADEAATGELTISEITEEDYLTQVNEAIDGAIGKNESITEVTLQDKILTIAVDISKANEGSSIQLPLEDIALSRASSITDKVLELDVSFWDDVVVDFGDIGKVTKTKSDIIESEYGKYFEIDALDGRGVGNSASSSIETKEISEEDIKLLVAASEAVLKKNFGTDYNISYQDKIVTINVWKEGIAAGALGVQAGTVDKSNWTTMVKSVQSMSDSIYQTFKPYDVSVNVNVLNDINKENTLLSFINGVKFYDSLE